MIFRLKPLVFNRLYRFTRRSLVKVQLLNFVDCLYNIFYYSRIGFFLSLFSEFFLYNLAFCFSSSLLFSFLKRLCPFFVSFSSSHVLCYVPFCCVIVFLAFAEFNYLRDFEIYFWALLFLARFNQLPNWLIISRAQPINSFSFFFIYSYIYI